MHSFGRSIGWHLGEVLVHALGSFAVVVAIIALAFYVAHRVRHARARSNHSKGNS